MRPNSIQKQWQYYIDNFTDLPTLQDKTKQLETITKYIKKHKAELPKLYRYSAADYWNIRSLETKTLKLIPASKMNDIYEGDLASTWDVKNQCRGFQEKTHLKSFSQNKNHLLMFSTYGDEYRGMSIEYDFSKLQDDYCLNFLYPVAYSKMRFITRNPDNLKNNRYFFLRKGIEWKYEHEWRLIMAEEGNEDFSPIVNINCITAVYLGERIDPTIRQHISEICMKHNIKLFDTILDHTNFKLKAIQVINK